MISIQFRDNKEPQMLQGSFEKQSRPYSLFIHKVSFWQRWINLVALKNIFDHLFKSVGYLKACSKLKFIYILDLSPHMTLEKMKGLIMQTGH